MLEALDAAAVHRWCAAMLEGLRRHQNEIDELNVYPVPDGDTGTNLVLTLASAQHALEAGVAQATDLDQPAHALALRQLARGALLGARGNSGVIVSQILRGLADALAAVAPVRGRALAGALEVASAAAYAAVAKPVEGTILTVAAAAAAGAGRSDTDDLATVVREAAAEAARALARTPQQLPVLARAGVVDAGGRGLVVLLDALVEVVAGVAPPERPASAPAPVPRPRTAIRETGSNEYDYEVQFLLDTDDEAVRRMSATLDGLGDSLVVVGTGAADGEVPTWNVHVHVNDVGAALEAGVAAGRPYQISVTRFADQTDPRAAAAHPPAAPAVDPAARATVVVAAGDGLAALFAGEGAAVVAGNPSTAELLAAIRSTAAGRVVVLPNDPNTQAVAVAAVGEAHAEGYRVRVIPTRSPVQALAALAVRDAGRRFEDDVIAMAEAAGACRYAEVCRASRAALTMAGRCRPGDVLALVEGEVHLIGRDLAATSRQLLDRMLGGGGELVTLLLGADAPATLADDLRAHLARAWPFAEVQIYDGGQPFYPLLVGVE
ncbi:MAG TPA: DAK2 domain-containing protein [Micromonosporaceae bacterium]|nr:DAK2 domain-containing protein [Micromonosporaceae bacterium]